PRWLIRTIPDSSATGTTPRSRPRRAVSRARAASARPTPPIRARPVARAARAPEAPRSAATALPANGKGTARTPSPSPCPHRLGAAKPARPARSAGDPHHQIDLHQDVRQLGADGGAHRERLGEELPVRLVEL